MVEWAAANLSRSFDDDAPFDGSDSDSSNELSNNQRRSKRRRTTETPEAAIARLTSAYRAAMVAVGALHKANRAIENNHKKRKNEEKDADNKKIPPWEDENIVEKSGEEDPTSSDRVRTSSARADTDTKDGSPMEIDEPTNSMIKDTENNNDDDKVYVSLKRVANAARQAFENAVLSDPLISAYAPTLSRTMQQLNKSNSIFGDQTSSPTPISQAHQITVKEIAYLSLVNYADLILSCCSCGFDGKAFNNDVLDRGAVRVLGALIHHQKFNGCDVVNLSSAPFSLWSHLEKEEDSKKLALVSYVDASDLDGSDPSTWLKVACGARFLGRISQAKEMRKMSNVSDYESNAHLFYAVRNNLSHSRLERYALERGLTALRPGIPCNRSISRAFHELESHVLDSQDSYISFEKACNTEKDILTIDLPRYSWSTLGRSLLIACKTTNAESICLKISPMLNLPSEAMGLICEFLGLDDGNGNVSTDLRKLEATCRALSADIISVRALIEKNRNIRLKQIEKEMHVILENENKPGKVDTAPNSSKDPDTQEDPGGRQSRANRTSKRVRSQLLTSGKQAERSAKRNSVQYCLVSSILPCTIDSPLYSTLSGELAWKKLDVFTSLSKITEQISKRIVKDADNSASENNTPSVNKQLRTDKSGDCHLNEASLNEFIRQCSQSNVGPLDILYRFLAHVSCYIEEVCLSEQGGGMILNSCLLDCFELLSPRYESHSILSPPWCGNLLSFSPEKCSKEEITIKTETLAINLLFAELQMRACERQVIVNNLFEDPNHKVKMMLPYLLDIASSLSEQKATTLLGNMILKLHVRVHWLAGVFYVWWSKSTQKLNDKKEAEKMALEHVGKAVSLLELPSSDTITTIKTPQLVSPGRSGNHWVELSVRSLSSFRDELESSTVLSHCRQKFFDILGTWKKSGYHSTTDLSDQDKAALESVGFELLQRYQFDNNSIDIGDKTDELIDDFVALHLSDLVTTEDDEEGILKNRWPSLWDLVPTKHVQIIFDYLSNSSFVTIMSLSLLCKRGYRVLLASLIGRLTMATLKMLYSYMEDSADSITNDNSSDSDSSYGNNLRGKDFHPKKANALTEMVHFFISKLWALVEESPENELQDIIKSIDAVTLIQFAINVSSGYFLKFERKLSERCTYTCPPHLDLLKTTLGFASIVRNALACEDARTKFLSSIFASLCTTIMRERKMISNLSSNGNNHFGRSECQRLCFIRSQYTSVVALEIAALLVSHQNTYSVELLEESFLIENLLTMQGQEMNKKRYTIFPLAQLAESLSWLWTYSSTTDTKATQCLRIPIAAAITTLVGSSGHANTQTIVSAFSQLEEKHSKELSGLCALSDFFESDDSANLHVDDNSTDLDDAKFLGSRRSILHALCRSVQCIGLVFSSLDDVALCSIETCVFSPINTGYFLPIIITKVLGNISDFVMEKYGDGNNASSRLWAEEYPFGFRRAGAQLDILLHKAYKCLHGIHLSSQNSHTAVSKDYAIPVTTASALTGQKFFPPLSVKASAQLYRCIMRAYAGGRRTIPIDSLECVLSALPGVEESDALIGIKDYLYHNVGAPMYSEETMPDILEPDYAIIDKKPEGVPEWIFDDERNSGDNNDQDEVHIIRKGICEYFTEGPLPCLGSSTYSSKPEESRTAKEREMASQAERAVHKKFQYIVESLKYKPHDASKWYRAGLCVGVKIDIILDRLPQASQGYNASEFYLKRFANENDRQTDFRKVEPESLPLVSLLEQQHKAYTEEISNNELDLVLGNDLSIFLETPWSSFSCLRDFSLRLGEFLRQRETSKSNIAGDFDGEFSRWSMIQSKFDEGNFADWQHDLGRMFVRALAQIREKCIRVAFSLSKKTTNKKIQDLHPEISESLGTMYYNDIGFSLRILTPFEIRQRSKLAQLFFQRALSSILETEGEDDLAEYELLLMVGKCQEKIAKTLQSESYSSTSGRLYEVNMCKALESYNKAMLALQNYEKQNGSLDIQAGGSAHGILEMIYRLHASRLKILLSAVKKAKYEREMAEIEALNITESFWFEKPKLVSNEARESNADIRERVWAVLADIVESMVHCRREQSFFHRSIFRHAQALLWAPLFHDPDGFVQDGSLALVPAHKSYRLRGLSSGSCAKSADAILNSLFDKKRPQLCAVWVTTPPSPSPFEYINDSSRKFDRLRCKYIGAFIDCMRLCRRRSILENFLKWCKATSRDLPSFYDETATEEGETPQSSHSSSNLITSTGLTYFAMKYANNAVAQIICQEISELILKEMNEKEWEKQMTELLGDAYKCFLRLNCPEDDSLWQSVKFKHQIHDGTIFEVEALCNAFMALNGIKSTPSIPISWEQKRLLFRFAAKEAEKLFPALGISSISMKKKRKRKNQETTNSKSRIESRDTVKKKIAVKVPVGLEEGQKFVITINCGYFRRNVQLLATSTKKIKFYLDIPKDAGSEIKYSHVKT